MIVRIATDAQYRLDDGSRQSLDELDDAVVDAVEHGEEADFAPRFAELLGFVRREGDRLDDDHLQGSDVILPPPDTTLAEAREEFIGEGLIPE